MSTDRERLKQVQVSQLSSNEASMTSTALAAVAAQNYRTFTVAVADAATAGTAVTETVVVHLPVKCKIISADVSAPIAVASHASDGATFTVAKRTGAGGATTVATASTLAAGLAGLAAFVPGTLTLSATASNLICAAGDVLTIAVAKNGSGKVLTAATSYVNVSVVVEEI